MVREIFFRLPQTRRLVGKSMAEMDERVMAGLATWIRILFHFALYTPRYYHYSITHAYKLMNGAVPKALEKQILKNNIVSFVILLIYPGGTVNIIIKRAHKHLY